MTARIKIRAKWPKKKGREGRERERESSPSQGRELETIKSETRGKANIR